MKKLKLVDPGMWLKIADRSQKKVMNKEELKKINPALRVFFEVRKDQQREEIRQDLIDIIDWSHGVNSL